MIDRYLINAQAVYDHARDNWGDYGWDWIYETQSVNEMAKELASRNIKTKAASIRYYWANLMDEMRSNCY